MRRFRGRAVPAAIAMLGVLALAACGGSEPTAVGDDEIVIAQGVDVSSGDPANQPALSDLVIGRTQFETLVARDRDGELVPLLAEEWNTIDDTTWDFTIRSGVTFHNGDPMTVEDVVFTFKRLLTPGAGFTAAANLSTIEKVEAVDDATVRIITKSPDAVLLSRLVWAPIVPKGYLESVGDEKFAFEPVGTGPYAFVSWTRDDRYVVERYEDYWGEKPANARLVFRTIPEASSRIAALQTGEANIITNVSPDLVGQIESNPELSLEPIPSARFVFVTINANEPPLDDSKIRQALNYAIDRQAIIDGVLDGHGSLTGTLFGPMINGYDDSIEEHAYSYDPEKARRLLAEAGYPDGLELDLEGPQGRYVADAAIVEAIGAQLEEVGVRVNLGISDWGTYYQRWVAHDTRHLSFLGQGNPLMDADYTYNILISTAGRGYFGNAEFDALIAEEQADLDPESRREKLVALHERLLEEAPVIFLWDQVDLYASTANLCGWSPRSDEIVELTEVHFCEE